jgi:hypothetical protein
MTNELDLIRKVAPPTAGPEPGLMDRERASFLAFARAAPPVTGDSTDTDFAGFGPAGRDGGVDLADPRPMAERSRRPGRRALMLVGAAAAAALVVAGVTTLDRDQPAKVGTAPTDQTVAPAADADPATGALAAVLAFNQARSRNDDAMAWELTGPLTQAVFRATIDRSGEPPSVVSYTSIFPLSLSPARWTYLSLPDEPGSGVVLTPSAPGDPAPTSSKPWPFPVVQDADGRWLVEFLAGGQDGQETPMVDKSQGAPGEAPSDAPLAFNGGSGKLYYRLDRTSPLVAATETTPGHYETPFTLNDLGPGAPDFLLVFRDAETFTAGS